MIRVFDQDGNEVLMTRPAPPVASTSPPADPRAEELAYGSKVVRHRQAKLAGVAGIRVWWWRGTAQGVRRSPR